jgi:hypothetical protein
MGLLDLFRKRSPNAALEAAVAGNDRRAIFEKLLRSSLLLPAPGVAGRKVEAGMNLSFVSMNDSLGRRAMIAFTGDAALRAWRPEGCECLRVPARELARMALASGLDALVLNPRGPVSGVIEKQALVALSEGRVPDDRAEVQVGAGTKMTFGRPAVPPRPELVEAIRSACAKTPGVSSAWLVQVSIDGGDPHLLLAIDAALPEQAIPRVMEGVVRALRFGEYIDATPLDANANAIRALGPAVFQR